MASTFRRRSGGATAAKAAATSTTSSSEAPLLSRRLAGTKLWTGGITLTSSGLRDLDNLLGAAAGQPLGTCIWLEEDRWTNRSLALSLIKYWCAEVGEIIRLSFMLCDLFGFFRKIRESHFSFLFSHVHYRQFRMANTW